MLPGRRCGMTRHCMPGWVAGLLGAHDVFELLAERAASQCAGVPLRDLPQAVYPVSTL
jgi:hypothetical protein